MKSLKLKPLELKVPPLAIVAVIVVLMLIIRQLVVYQYPIIDSIKNSSEMSILIGISLKLLGFGLAFSGVLAFRKHQTTVNPFTPSDTSSIVTTGIYNYTRNPMYLGFLVFLIGTVFVLNSYLCLLFIPVYLGYMTLFQIMPEERILKEEFGLSYSKYIESTRRWL